MDSNIYYIATLGANEPDTIIRYTHPIIASGIPFQACEVYSTPFEAAKALNKEVKIMPENHITFYKARIECAVTISTRKTSRILVLHDIEFEKDKVCVLGSMVHYL